MNLIKLENGMRIATQQLDHTRSASIYFFIGCGSRYEDREILGASHFIEHMLFRGTEKRSSKQLAEEMDFLGGQLNAFTTKEYTCLYAQVLKNHVATALDIMCDMLCNPLMSDNDIAIEKGVVLEEISMYEDSPEELCADLLCESVWNTDSLGFNILGTRNTVNDLNSKKLKNYMQNFYVPERMTVAICGNFDENEAVDILKHYFSKKQNTGNFIKPATPKFNQAITLKQRDFEQTHMILGFKGLPLGDKNKYAAAIFSAVTGGTSSSRLNRRIREELGLAYSVYTFITSYLGTGLFGIGAGINHSNQIKAMEEILKILEELRNGISQEELYRTKEQFKAVMVMGMESSSALASAMGRGLLLENKYTDVDTMIKKIDEVTVEDIQNIACILTDPSNMALTVVGRPEAEQIYSSMFCKYCHR
ncbi:MAG TPA: insulinase family protein [Clostridiales bacterium]|nr:insulinase family protein [Clostridiales bacterium]